ncbi:MAG: penicillin-binding transpeptidase domain-containing protein, partial [Elusimicrobia bacterium]|nr:penicillin-binding transpeptidase domain-containing protein [Elusimicrobiota bacterium]
GRGGLEQQYDFELRGQDGGWQIEVDALGRQTKMLRYIPSVKGNSLYTTIDSKLQEAAYQALKKSATKKGAAIVIDPRNGAVKALVSVPGFNPDISAEKEFLKYLKDKELPLFNRAIQALYPPGSVFKVITFIGAVSDNIVNPKETYTCEGSFTLGNRTFACWLKTGHGKMSLIPAMANSCNVYFYNIGLKIGQKILESIAKEFKIGAKTGIDLPSEKKGLLPSSEWKLKKRNMPWLKGDTVNMAIGQGPLLVTPIQIASMIVAVANGGTLYKPYIVEKISDPDGNILYAHEQEIRGKIELSENTWKLLKNALETAVSNGTGRGCSFSNIKVAGKTGTSQNPQGEDHAWFASYAPADNPEIAVTVLVEHGGTGGHAAVPVARAIYEQYFGLSKGKTETKNISVSTSTVIN